MKMNLVKGYILAQIEENNRILWTASYLHHGKYPVISYEDPYRILVIKYKNDIDALNDYTKRLRILSNTHKIESTPEGNKFICENYRIKFGLNRPGRVANGTT